MARTVFIGGIYPEFKEKEIIDRFGHLPQDAADMFQKNLIYGIQENTGAPVTVFNTYFLPSTFTGFEKTEYYEWQGKYGTNYNLSYTMNRIFGFSSKTRAIIAAVSDWIEKNASGSTVNVIVYPAYFPFLRAVCALKRKYKLNVCLVVPDLPEFMGLTQNRTLYNKYSERYSVHQFGKYLGCVDSFVFLTEYMNQAVNTNNKPYRIIEGIAPHDYTFITGGITPQRNIVYSGRLQMKYGIDNYLKAVSLIDDDSVCFDFYGTGEGVDLIKSVSEKDRRVRYKGYLLPEELHRVHQTSLLLINPRQNDHAFTKYSFPSKTMEYMMSGRPVIAYKLDGMPDEYKDYIISPADNSPEALSRTIIRSLSTSEEELEAFGLKARDFVIRNKNSLAQTEKILELLDI